MATTTFTSSDASPPGKGTYLLFFIVKRPVRLRLGRSRRRLNLGQGTYVYVGSALGPGGARARLRRHFHKDKRPFWDIDHLTLAVLPSGCFLFRPEIAESQAALRLSRVLHPVDSFGAADDSSCKTHLFMSDAGLAEVQEACLLVLRASLGAGSPIGSLTA